MNLFEILSNSREHDSPGEHKFLGELFSYLQTLVVEADQALQYDGFGNIWFTNGTPEDYPFLFACHIDTCHKIDGEVPVMLDKYGYARLTDSRFGCLGADDGVGIFVNLEMIRANVKGTYLFCRGEEAGNQGAKYIIEHHEEELEAFSLCIEVDRQGTEEVVVEQCTGKGASDTFGRDLCDALGMGHTISYMGIYTDNALFNTFIPECVNVAAGYDRQHSPKERVKVGYVFDLVGKMITIDWSLLTIERKTHDLGADTGYGWYDTSDYDAGYYDYQLQDRDVEKLSDKSLDMDEAMLYIRAYPERVAAYLYLQGASELELEEDYQSCVWVNN